MIFMISIVLSSKILPKMYLHFMQNKLDQAQVELLAGKNIRNIENKYSVTIIEASYKGKTIDDFNEEVKREFENKRVSLNKFWIIPEQLQKVKNDKSVKISYSQGKQKSSFFTSWSKKDDSIYVIGISVVFFSEMSSFFLYYLIGILVVVLIIISLVIRYQSNKIVNPILIIKKKAEQISNREYVNIGVYPNNEIGDLAKSIDIMSSKLKTNEEKLIETNDQIKKLSANLAHELKTPISIIEAYTQAIKDGMGDDSFLDEIFQQTAQLNSIVSDMVRLISLQDSSMTITPVDLGDIFTNQVNNKKSLLENTNRTILWNQTEHRAKLIEANEILITLLFSNVLNNAIKHGTGLEIIINDYYIDSFWVLEIRNETDYLPSDIESLWEPFITGDAFDSAGTGLGLSIVKEIADKFNIGSEILIENNIFMIRFTFDT